MRHQADITTFTALARRQLLLLVMAPVLVCMAAAPAIAERAGRVAAPGSGKNGRTSDDLPAITPATLDVADIRTESVTGGGDSRRGKVRSRACRKMLTPAHGLVLTADEADGSIHPAIRFPAVAMRAEHFDVTLVSAMPAGARSAFLPALLCAVSPTGPPVT